MATFLYNPDRKPKQALIAEFVVRTGIYEEIMHDLETSKMKHPEQHYLLVGQRGAGKTTLLNRIKYGVEDSAKLKKTLIPVLFNEEQYHISELVNLWEAVAQYLEDYQGFDGLYEEMEANADKAHYEELSYEVLEKHLRKSGKKLVLLIDNVGDLLKRMGKTEVHRLREILQTKSEIRLIAGSPFYLETILDYQQPLFEFFKVLRLDGLNQKETQELLLKLAELNGEEEKIKKVITETPGRVETLRTLTGGVPRTIALMYNIFVKYNDEDAVKDLEKILDAVTPLYKHRMDDLPTQQQKIMDAVAKNWDGIGVKELKEKTRIESKIISAQLRQLEKNQVIEKVETNTKNHLYFLKERFFNIWYLMRYGRKQDKQRVIWLVKFLESWCTMNELEQRIVDYVNKIAKGKLDDQMILFYGEVYTAMNHIRTEMKILLKESTPKHLSRKIKIENKEIYRIAYEKFKNGEFENSVDLLKNLEKPNEQISESIAFLIWEFAMTEGKLFLELIEDILDSKFSSDKAAPGLNYYDEVMLLIFNNYASFQALAKGDFEKAFKSLKMLVELQEDFNETPESTRLLLIGLALITFLNFNQGNIVMNVFKEWPDLKDKLKPAYYFTLKELGMDSEFKKMGPELYESVNRLIGSVAKARKGIELILEKRT